jgi:hypothetical protein
MRVKPNPALARLGRAVGTWTTIGTHPYLPGRTLHGWAPFEWIEGGAFLVMRTKMEDPEVPAGVAIFGTDDEQGGAFRLYFDERVVSRKYDVAVYEDGFSWSRNAPGFSQRFRITIGRDGRTMEGRGEMSRDGSSWEKDLDLSYARAP